MGSMFFSLPVAIERRENMAISDSNVESVAAPQFTDQRRFTISFEELFVELPFEELAWSF